MYNAESYLLELAQSVDEFSADFEYTNVEVPDPVAGRMAADPRINVTNVEKGDFGLDVGTMVIDFKIRCSE